jgi:hypothetical protein
MDDPDTQNANTTRIAVTLVAVIALGGGAWWYFTRPVPVTAAPAEIAEASTAEVVTPTAAVDAVPAIRHPLDKESGTAAVDAGPDAASSDASLTAALTSLFGAATVKEWLITDGIGRRLVATVDNLPRNSHIERQRPLRPPQIPFVVERETVDASTGTERIALSKQNFARYDAVVGLLARTDMQQAAAAYQQLYPLLQAAYEDLGYPGRYFNDRVVEMIDHLLETPEPAGTVLLVQPKVLYQYADATLEARSAGQKLLLRMGVEHARTIKLKLRELRAVIAKPETASIHDYRSFHVAR